MGERVSRVRATWRETTDRDRVDQPISDRLTVCDSINVRLKSALQRFVKYRKDRRFTLSILIAKFNFRIVFFFFRILYRIFQEAFWIWFSFKKSRSSRWIKMIFSSRKWIDTGYINWWNSIYNSLKSNFRSECNIINNNHFNPFQHEIIYWIFSVVFLQ